MGDRRRPRSRVPARRARSGRARGPEQRREVASGPVQMRLDDLEREAGCDGTRRTRCRRCSSTAMPAAEASQCVDATMPKVPRSSGRVVKLIRQGRYPWARRRSEVQASPARDEMAGDEMTRRERRAAPGLLVGRGRRQARAVDSACGSDSRTAAPAGSARRRRARSRSRVSLHLGVGHDGGREQRLRVRMLGIAEELARAAQLHDLAEVHHCHAVAEVLDRREVVRDEEAREAEVAAGGRAAG